MVFEEAENSESGMPSRRLSQGLSSSSTTQEDVVMEMEGGRFDKRPISPKRRVSCISSFGRKAAMETPNFGSRNQSFGGRRFSMDLSRPRLSPAFKRDRSLNKLYSEMETATRKTGEETGALVHDLEIIQTLNLTTGKRIDNLINALAEMRANHRKVFPERDGSTAFISRRSNR